MIKQYFLREYIPKKVLFCFFGNNLEGEKAAIDCGREIKRV